MMLSRLGVGFLLLAACASASGSFWNTGWYANGQPDWSAGTTALIRTSTGQLVFFYGNDTGPDYQVTSMTPAGTTSWQINVTDNFEDAKVAAGPDGSVFVSTSQTTARIDASGHVLWHRADLGAYSFAVANDALYVGGCAGVARLDVDSGATLWFVEGPSPKACISNVGTDAAGNVYLITIIGVVTPYSISSIRLAKFDPNGVSLWETPIPNIAGYDARILGASDGRVFVEQGPDTGAYDASSGAPLWVQSQMTGLLLAGLPRAPLANDVNGMHRLNPIDGHIEWTSGRSDSLLIAGQDDDAYACSYGLLGKFNATTGMGDWSFDLHATPWSCLALALGGGDVFAASIDPTTSVRIDTLDSASGTGLSTSLMAPTQQGLVVYDAFLDSGRILQAGEIFDTTNYRLRSVDAGTGSVDWDVAFSPPLRGWGPQLGHSADSVIVTDYTGTGWCSYCGNDVWIGSFARSDGALRWSNVVRGYAPPSGISTAWASAPSTDSHGDVYVSYSQSAACPTHPSDYCYVSTLMKLASGDGSVLWHFDAMADYDASFYGTYGNAPPFTLIDDDILVAGYFTGALAGRSIVRLSGADGSVLWTAAPLPPSATNFLTLNPDHTITLGDGSSRALLQDDGSVLWTDTPQFSCFTSCESYGVAQLADGTQLYAGVDVGVVYPNIGYVMSLPLVQNAPVRRASVNADAPANVRSIPVQLIADDHAVWLRGSMRQPPSTVFYFIGKLDPVTLVVNDQQVLSTRQADAFAPGSLFNMLAAPSDGALPVNTNLWGDGAPYASGAALWDTTIAAHGDLALGMTATDNTDDSTFQATVAYTGDAPVANVHFMLWHQGYYDAGALACTTTSATNCVATSQFGYVDATFDIQPGGSVRISGSYPTEKNILSTLYGSVHGPASLAESSLGNNFSSAPIGDLLFRDGFQSSVQ